jgi:hypothetical protein
MPFDFVVWKLFPKYLPTVIQEVINNFDGKLGFSAVKKEYSEEFVIGGKYIFFNNYLFYC